MRDDDATLVAAVLEGRPGAFTRLVRAHQRLVGFVIGRMAHNREDVAELAQETFLRVHQQLAQFRGESSLATWVGQVAWSIALRHLQKKRIALVDEGDADELQRRLEAVPAADDVPASVSQLQAAERLGQAMARLAPLPRLLLALYHLQEMEIGEIAQLTALPEGTIKSHLFRARARLRAELEELR